jgi:hypothetical protein
MHPASICMLRPVLEMHSEAAVDCQNSGACAYTRM